MNLMKQVLKQTMHRLKSGVLTATFHKYICFPQIVRCRERSCMLKGFNLTLSRFFFRHTILNAFFLSGVGDDFTIEFTVHFVGNGLQINSIVDLSTPVFGKIEITDPSGIPQNLDVHLREVTADIDDSPTGDDFALIEDG